MEHKKADDMIVLEMHRILRNMGKDPKTKNEDIAFVSEVYKMLEKSIERPEGLTREEKKRLSALGVKVDIIEGKKQKKRNRFVEDDPDSLIGSSSAITDEEKKRAEEILKEMTGEVNHDFSDMDIINKWVIAHDIGENSRLEEARQKYGGNSLIGFVYVDHMAGITLEIETFCTVGADGDITTTLGPRDHNASLKLRYGVLKPTTIELLSQDQIKSLSLSEKPEWLKFYDDPDLERIRQLEFLHPFRAPGFPDDIQVLLPPVKGKGEEVVWARIESYREDGVFVCTLLNQPYQDFKINPRDRIEVVPATIGDELGMLCKTVIDKHE